MKKNVWQKGSLTYFDRFQCALLFSMVLIQASQFLADNVCDAKKGAIKAFPHSDKCYQLGQMFWHFSAYPKFCFYCGLSFAQK